MDEFKIETADHQPYGGALEVGFVTETFPPEVNGMAKTLARIIAEMAERGIVFTLSGPTRKPQIPSAT